MKFSKTAFPTFVWRITALHMITYFAVGMLALYLMDYRVIFRSAYLEHFMRPTDDPVTALGPALQFLRGLIFGLVLWPFRGVLLKERFGWLYLWMLFTGLGILATFGPAPGSVDGLIYTQIPWSIQFIFLPELLLQSFLLSLAFYLWYRKPHIAWDIVAAVMVSGIILMSVAGYLFLSQ